MTMKFYERKFDDSMHVHALSPSDYLRQCPYAAGFPGLMLPGKCTIFTSSLYTSSLSVK